MERGARHFQDELEVLSSRLLEMAYATTYRPRPAYDGTRETSVYLVPGARGRGLGRTLYDELLRRVDDDGIHVCLAVIAQPNAASEALHAAVGFEWVGTLREVGRKFDRWVDTALWQRLRPEGLRSAQQRPGRGRAGRKGGFHTSAQFRFVRESAQLKNL